jgi:hypothetical protein
MYYRGLIGIIFEIVPDSNRIIPKKGRLSTSESHGISYEAYILVLPLYQRTSA